MDDSFAGQSAGPPVNWLDAAMEAFTGSRSREHRGEIARR